MTTLGAELKKFSDEILSLLLKSKDPKVKKELRAQLAKVHHHTARLVDANVDAATQEYRDATAGLKACIGEIRTAQEDLGNAAKLIHRIAQAIHLVEKVVAKLA